MKNQYICATGNEPFVFYVTGFHIDNSGQAQGHLTGNASEATKFTKTGMAELLSGKDLSFRAEAITNRQ